MLNEGVISHKEALQRRGTSTTAHSRRTRLYGIEAQSELNGCSVPSGAQMLDGELGYKTTWVRPRPAKT